MSKVLIIEDEQDLVDLLSIHLRDLALEVENELDGQKGLEKALKEDYALIVLDLMLPGLNGIEVCKALRKADNMVPILMLTAKSEEFDKVFGLEIGADDYMTKPFSIREFIARAKALLRRTSAYNKEEKKSESLHFGELIIDPEKHKVLLKGEKMELTPKEFDLLYLMAQHPGKSYTRGALLQQVWGYDFSGYEHTVNSHINRLRSKIEDNPDQPVFIKTVWGVGYAFSDEF